MLWIPSVFIFLIAATIASGYPQEAELIQRLLDPQVYNNEMRPNINAEPLKVKLGMSLAHINELNTEKGYLDGIFWLRLAWDDQRLKYDDNQFDVLRLISTDIWTPKIQITNGLTSNGIQYNNFPMRILVYSNGACLGVPPARILSTCAPDLTYFPMDSQTCSLKFLSYDYNSDELQFELYNHKPYVDMSDFWSSSDWAFQESNGFITEESIGMDNTTFSTVTFTVTFRRRHQPYLFNIIIPTVVISFLSLLSVFVPINHLEKIVVSVGSIVSLILMLLHIGRIAKSGVPIMGKYIIFLITMNLMHLIGQILAINWSNANSQKGEAPKFVKEVLLGKLGGLVWLKIKPAKEEDKTQETPKEAEPSKNNAETTIMNSVKEQRKDETVQTIWNQAALVVERLLFIIMFLVTVVAGIIYLTHFPGYRNEDEAIESNKFIPPV